MRTTISSQACSLRGRTRTSLPRVASFSNVARFPCLARSSNVAQRSISAVALFAALGLGIFLSGCEARLGVGDLVEGGRGNGSGNSGSGSGAGTTKELQVQCEKLSDGLHPGPSPIRRLTRAEYDRTVEDLLDDGSAPGSAFPPEARALGFNGVAEAQTVTSLLVEAYLSAAEGLADRATENLDGLLGCDPMNADCVSDFVGRFGGLAYRRPLSDAEAARLVTVFEWGRDHLDVTEGI